MQQIYKWYRQDKNLWEQKILILSFIPLYKYSIWKDGRLKVFYRILKYRNPKYIKQATKTNIYIGRKEFKEKYNNNKYLVPLNFEINLKLP